MVWGSRKLRLASHGNCLSLMQAEITNGLYQIEWIEHFIEFVFCKKKKKHILVSALSWIKEIFFNSFNFNYLNV